MKTRVMIIDDDADLRRVLARALMRSGYDVYTAAGGLPALRLAELTRPDILLVDYTMALPGSEIVRHVRAHLGSSVYVCVLTGDADSAVREGCMNAGADDVVEKPISMGELRVRLAAGVTTPCPRAACG